MTDFHLNAGVSCRFSFSIRRFHFSVARKSSCVFCTYTLVLITSSTPCNRHVLSYVDTLAVPTAIDHLGRRTDHLLFQSTMSPSSTRVVPKKPIPNTGGETDASQEDWLNHDADQQLVQESATTRQNTNAIRSGQCSHVFARKCRRFAICDSVHFW